MVSYLSNLVCPSFLSIFMAGEENGLASSFIFRNPKDCRSLPANDADGEERRPRSFVLYYGVVFLIESEAYFGVTRLNLLSKTK